MERKPDETVRVHPTKGVQYWSRAGVWCVDRDQSPPYPGEVVLSYDDTWCEPEGD